MATNASKKRKSASDDAAEAKKPRQNGHETKIEDDGYQFPVDLSAYMKLEIDPWSCTRLTPDMKEKLKANIQLCRDAIVFFTACGSASGYGGHTGGAFDTVPEVMLMDAFFRACPDKFVPTFFDEAGHRVATQYLLSVLHGHMPASHLRNYRKGHSRLPGHPELGLTPGVKFSSGRLGHMWPYVNGVAMANPDKVIFCLGSDGSQMEGNDAEAARLAVAAQLNVKLLIDDNNVTIAGHPSDYLQGYSVERTLRGHGLQVATVAGEDLDSLYTQIRLAVTAKGPCAVIAKRSMCPGIKGAEGECHGHDALAKGKALAYFKERKNSAAVAALEAMEKTKDPQAEYLGSEGPRGSNRNVFGQTVAAILSAMSEAARKEKVMVIDADLMGSTGLKHIHKATPDIFHKAGVMERGNISAAAGFGMQKGKQGVFATFAAFLEMCTSEITMARLNRSNLLCHFSHSGCDDMADNTCHFGLNNFFADNGLQDEEGGGCSTRLYFPCEPAQMEALTKRVFWDEHMRFIFSIRSKLPAILKDDGSKMYGGDYVFQPGVDELVREGDGYIVSFGDALYRCVDASERLKKEGISVGVVNKPTLNVVDEEMMKKLGSSKFVLVVEPLSRKTGLGIRFGTWLLERGFAPKYNYKGIWQEGSGGLWEHAYHQGYDSKSIQDEVKKLAA